MKLKYKLFISVISIGIFILFLGLIIFYRITTISATEFELKNNKENVVYASETIENNLLDLVRLTTTLATTDVIRDSLISSNNYYGSLTSANREIIIDDLNITWMNTDDIDDPFIKLRMDNDVASFLNSQQDEYPELYGEIFLTNEYGVMISTTGKLTTLAHYEKYWWQGAFDNGNGIVYIDDRGYDSSVDGYVLGIVVPIYDDEDKIIGMLKSNFNIAYIFEKSVSGCHSLRPNGECSIVRSLGLIVNGKDIEPLSESVSDILIDYLDERLVISKEVTIDNEDYFVAIAPINLTFKSDIVDFGGRYESIDHTDGNLGEGWNVIYITDRNVALSGLRDTFQPFAILFIGLLILLGIVAFIVAHLLTKPIVILNNYISDVANGNLVRRDIKVSGDEIGNLTKSFGIMIDNINKTLISNEVLEYERDVAQMYLDVAGVIFLILDINGNIVLINKKGCEILGAEEKLIIGANWFDNYIPKNIIKETKEIFINTFKKETDFSNNYENNIINTKGEKRLISWHNIVLYDINKEKIGVLSSGEDITESKRAKDELIRIGYEDSLTGLKNRRYYEENLSLLDVQKNYPLTIIMADINGLKLINDAFGHVAGDELLIASANILENLGIEKFISARIGGDEFVLVLPNTNETEAEKIITEIHNKAKFIKINSIPLSVSFGYKTKHKSSENIQEIYRSAEDAMYREKLIEIPSMRGGAIETILSTLYEKDENSEIHSRRVSRLSERLAKAYGLNRIDVMKVKTAGLLHDIGKIIIPVTILKKVGPLTKEEYDYMKTHSEIGFRILNSTAEMREISDIVLNHHERWDGKGYPRGIQANKIPLESRIIAIADAYDAMTSERTYREIMSKEETLKEILDNAGTQFDPELVKVFEQNFKEIIS